MFPRELQISAQSAKKIQLGEAVSKVSLVVISFSYHFVFRIYLFVTMDLFHLGNCQQ
jgi:glycyl-tRNA synthetase